MPSARSIASASLLMAPGEPGTTGRPSLIAATFASTLSPIMEICSGVGPMKVKPCSSTIEANFAFSDRKPMPGWIASAPAMLAAVRMAGILR